MSESDQEQLAELARVVHDALESGETAGLHAVLGPDVTWGSCKNRDEVIAFIDSAAEAGFAATDIAVEVVDDRLVSCLSFGSGEEAHRTFQAVFVRDGLVVEIADAVSHEAARTTRPMQRTGGSSASFSSVAPVLPVNDVDVALAHYAKLGFTVRRYEGAAHYGYASRDGVDLHVARVDVDPKTNMCSIYLYVTDADATYLEWRDADVAGRLVAPQDTDYGLREGAHIDPDGNLIRFGSPT